MDYEYVVQFSNGQYWAGGVGEYFMTPHMLRAYKDSEYGHKNTIERKLKLTRGFPEHQLWNNCKTILLED